ncbi:MAG: hypothetical protein LBD90_09720 [Bifidobacteriaceae bacterium]|jgi:hypothetical protein|nr:hypothetical protein [Bifidobacteriaceae bacterium]
MSQAAFGAGRHAVIATPRPLADDVRARRLALAARDMGYRVTLVWARDGGGEVEPGELAGVTTIGLAVPYHLRARLRRRDQRAAERRLWTFGLAYPTADARRVAAAELAARRMRLAGAPAAAGLRAAEAVHRARSVAYSAVASAPGRRLARRRARRGWRVELAEVADLDAVFTAQLVELRPDLLQVEGVSLLGAGVWAKRRLAADGRAVSLVYDALEYVSGAPRQDALKAKAYAAMERELIGEADAVVTASQALADRLGADFSLSAKPVAVLDSPPRGAAAATDRGLRAELGLGPDVPLAVHSDAGLRDGGFEPLLGALLALPEVHLAVVKAPGAADYRLRQLSQRAWALSVDDRVHVVEPVAPERMTSFLADATFGLHVLGAGSEDDAMALPRGLFDQLWAGLPMAVAAGGAKAELVEKAGIGATFDPAEAESVAAAASAVMADRDAHRAAAARPGLREGLAWERQASRLAELYRGLGPEAA